MELQFYDVLRFIIIFVFLFLAVFLFTLNKGSRLSNRLFALFLFCKAMCFTHSLSFRFPEAFINFSPHVFFIGESFEFLLGPALFLYAQSLAYNEFKLKWSHTLHLIPFIAHAVFMTYKFHMFSSAVKLELLQSYVTTYAEFIIVFSVIYIQFIGYSIAAIITIRKYHMELKNIYSTIDNLKLSWLMYITAGFIILWGTAMIHFIMAIAGYRFTYPIGLSVLLLFVFANFIMYKGLRQPDLFAGLPNKKSNGKLSIPEKTYNNYVNNLNSIMLKERPYLEPTLTLNDLAERMSIPPRYVSHVINKSYNKNFFDYINSYRIRESQKLLSNPEYSSRTVLEILYDSGFNSKSVFNSAFKKFTGTTPTQFKREAFS